MTPHQRQTVCKGWLGFMIPGSRLHGDRSILAQSQSHQGDDREQGQQDGGGACDGVVGPLPLGLHPEVGSHLFT
jgi:hypothetical protein